MAVSSYLSERDWRMIRDDSFYDNVTKKEVRMLLNKMAWTHMSRKDIIRIRIKYDNWIDDGEKKFMTELGVDYRTHTITRDIKGGHYYVNGYTAVQWKMLTDEGYDPSLRVLMSFLNQCREKGDTSAQEILMLKYQKRLQERDEKIIKRHNLPSGLKYNRLDSGRIDGITPYHWRLLYDDDFVPPRKGFLLSTIKKLRDEGYADDAEKIEQKYIHFLYPEAEEPDLHEDIKAAREFFRSFYPYSCCD